MNNQDVLGAALGTFMEEARDLIAEMEQLLLQAENGDCAGEDLNALFRSAHTIKGSAGLFGLDEVVRFTHVVESVLVRLRDGDIGFTPDLVSVLLASQDHIATLIGAIAAGESSDAYVPHSDELIARLAPWSLAHAPSAPPSSQQTAPMTSAPDPQLTASGGGAIGTTHWHISLRFDPCVLTDGMDPLGFIKYLGRLGRIVHLETIPFNLPSFEEADPEQCYLGFEIAFDTQATKAEIEDVFEFVADRANISILPPNSKIGEYIQLIDSLPEDNARIGEILVACGSLTAKELTRALTLQKEEVPPQRLGEILIEQYVMQPALVEAAAEKQRRNEEKRSGESKSVKVPADRLDALINRVGELVIAGAGTFSQSCKVDRPELQESASVLLSLVESVRDMVLSLRMVAIGEVFSRFPRVVRDVSKELGKGIDLQISGAEAELDKSMIEKVADPLMHLIRNSMDHGIEPGEERLARGKPERGTVELNAYHESGLIVIEVKDDGRGLDPDKILRKAIEKGLVAQGTKLSQQEIFRLILEPGFSTADQVSNLSGRGVGMDVVRSNVEALRGTLDIQSTPGHGTRMRLCLPLTLAIIDGFHVGVGSSHFIVPLDMVVECIELPEGLDRVDYLELRDEALPFVRLRKLFHESGPAHARPRVVVVRFSGRRVGLVVDRIYGKCQTVIKPLGPLFEHVPCVSGSTILGDGEVALILDVAQLISNVVTKEWLATHTTPQALESQPSSTPAPVSA